MRVLTFVKHVPDTTGLALDPVTGQPMLAAAPTKISDYDRHAMEEAARLGQERGAEVVVLGVGPPEAARTLKEALAVGGSEALLVAAPVDGLVDPGATARLLAAAVRRYEPFDVVLCGDVSEDGYHGLVPGMVAALLGVPHVAGVTRLEAEDGGAQVTRTAEDAVETYRIRWPAVLSVSRAINRPRFVTAVQVMKVPMSRVSVYKPGDLGVDEAELAAERQATRIVGLRAAGGRPAAEMLTGSPEEMVDGLLAALARREVLP
jgi:electron transfer flavoprotein beta subunit